MNNSSQGKGPSFEDGTLLHHKVTVASGNKTPTTSTSSSSTKKHKRAPNKKQQQQHLPGRTRLPDKLMDHLDNEELDDAIWWLPDGKSLAMNSKRVQERLLDVHFRKTKLTSFIRSLNRWGFRRVFIPGMPPNTICFRCDLFQRDDREGLADMELAPVGITFRQPESSSDSDSESSPAPAKKRKVSEANKASSFVATGKSKSGQAAYGSKNGTRIVKELIQKLPAATMPPQGHHPAAMAHQGVAEGLSAAHQNLGLSGQRPLGLAAPSSLTAGRDGTNLLLGTGVHNHGLVGGLGHHASLAGLNSLTAGSSAAAASARAAGLLSTSSLGRLPPAPGTTGLSLLQREREALLYEQLLLEKTKREEEQERRLRLLAEVQLLEQQHQSVASVSGSASAAANWNQLLRSGTHHDSNLLSLVDAPGLRSLGGVHPAAGGLGSGLTHLQAPTTAAAHPPPHASAVQSQLTPNEIFYQTMVRQNNVGHLRRKGKSDHKQGGDDPPAMTLASNFTGSN